MRPDSPLRSLASLALALTATLCLPARAHASWDGTPQTVISGADSIGAIATCRDGGAGAYVAFHAGPVNAGVLRVQHVLGTGDADPAWPAAGVTLCSVATRRTAVGLVADSTGGGYVWWLEGSDPQAIFVRRFDANGVPDARWPVRGKFMGSTAGGWRPSACEDGHGGIFLAWSTVPTYDGTLDVNTVLVSRLGLNGLNQSGWLSQNRVITLPYALHFPPAITRSGDDGVLCAFAKWSEDSVSVPNGFYMNRLAANGTFANGFTVDGLRVATFNPVRLARLDLDMTHVAADTSGGFYLSLLQPDEPAFPDGPPSLSLILQRRTASGALAAGWDESGFTIGNWTQDAGSPAFSRACTIVPDGTGLALAAVPSLGTDAPAIMQVRRVGPGPAVSGTDLYGYVNSFELRADLSGGADVASSWPCWALFAFGTTAPPEVILRAQSPVASAPRGLTLTGPDTPNTCLYGAASITPTSDGAAIGVFVQLGSLTTLRAVRINLAGVVAGVPPASGARGLALRAAAYDAAAGVRVHYVLPGGGAARLEAFDTQGRRLATRVLSSANGEGESAFGEARTWPSGVYLLRLSRGGNAAGARVTIVR